MKELFEIEWLGGAAEKHFRKLRPMGPNFPWGTLDAKKYSPSLVDRARVFWSSIARSEYRAAASFADVLGALLAAKAPLDLIGMAGDFIADEVLHVELASRLAMEIGGGAPVQVDFERMGIRASSLDLTARQRANELVLRIGCISETLSGAIAVETLRDVEHPLVAQVVEQIARDEARHTRLGWLYLEWAADDMDDDERARLADIASREIRMLAPGSHVPVTSPKENSSKAEHEQHELGRISSRIINETVARTIREDILVPLSKYGITVDLSLSG